MDLVKWLKERPGLPLKNFESFKYYSIINILFFAFLQIIVRYVSRFLNSKVYDKLKKETQNEWDSRYL
jgi:hypothetical protein